MQLQIQTFRPNTNTASSELQYAQLPSVKDLFPSTKVLLPPQSLLSQLRQIQLTAKAHYHYLTNIRRKAFRLLYEEDYEAEISLLEKGFLAFKLNKLQNKNSKNVFKKMMLRLDQNKQRQNFKKEQMNNAKTLYDQCLLRKIFTEVFFMIKIRKKQQQLQRFLKIQHDVEFFYFLKQASRQSKHQRLKNEEEKEQVDRIYQKLIMRKVFNQWKTFGHSNKLQKLLKYKALQRLIRKLIEQKRDTILKIQNFHKIQALKQKKYIFDCLKETKLQSQCRDWYKYRLQKLCFLKWLEFHKLSQQQQQIEQSNEIILQHYLEQKEAFVKAKLQLKYFRLWNSCIQFEKEQKKEAVILSSFAQLKEKQYLERKYFLILINNRNYEKALKFYHKSIKLKALVAFRKNLIAQSKKLEGMLKFLLKNRIGKYFQRIQYFNQEQNQKIRKFLLQKVWIKFTFEIASQYFQKMQKAHNYHKICLKFKSMFGMKKNVQVHKKAEFCAFHLNVVMPLQRWNQRYRIRKLINEKEFYLLKRILFQWRYISVKKILSKEKQAKMSELCVESRIQSEKKIRTYKEESSNLESKNSTESVSDEISFFKKMNHDESEEDESDQMTKRVDSLLTKIKKKRDVNKKQMAELHSISGFSQERLMLGNQSASGKDLKQTYEKLRLPTWSSPGNDYRVSVFSEDAED